MNLPIGVYGLIIGVCALVALASGAWLVLRARDIARLTSKPDNAITTGRARKPPADKVAVRVMLAIMILSSIIALGLFAAIAAGAIDSSDTRTDPYAQRP
ncbi:MAG: hypothetical protein LH465_03575 [Sphingomonas bacterium]|nr:hypothetical protein [Sphingomonas bacterium]